MWTLGTGRASVSAMTARACAAISLSGAIQIPPAARAWSTTRSRVATLERVVEHARAGGGIWIAPLGEIAAHTRTVIAEADARPVPAVHIEEDVYGR